MIVKSAFLKYLLKYAEQFGIKIRSEAGNFKSGYCTANDVNLIILNRRATEKTMCEIIFLALKYFKYPIPADKESVAFCRNEMPDRPDTYFEIDLTGGKDNDNEEKNEK